MDRAVRDHRAPALFKMVQEVNIYSDVLWGILEAARIGSEGKLQWKDEKVQSFLTETDRK